MALHQLLPRAPMRLSGSFHYDKDQEAAGDDKGDKSKADDKEETKTALPQTQEELDAFLEAAFEARERERREKKKAKEKKQREREETDEDDGDEEDAAELVRKAEQRAATAEQERDEAQKKALLADVSVKLRDHLHLNFREFIGNAPDIMLHIEKALSPNAKDAEVARLIDSHSKAFVERTKAARKPASGAPTGGVPRDRAKSLAGGTTDDGEQRRTVTPKAEVGAPARWSTINFNG